MKVISSPDEMQAYCRERARGGNSLGLVPTMGALHAGHLALVRASRAHDAITAASIFVNPKQFGPTEDFSRYPRQLDKDIELFAREGVDVVFTPDAETMYPAGFATTVEVTGLSDRLCGHSRPGHFRGVTTVVLKLLNIVQPARAYFGQKDAAQLAIIRRLTRDLHLPIEIVGCPIVRDSDGLALSSRNAYLSPEERASALALSRALKTVGDGYCAGERNATELIETGLRVIEADRGVRLDYFEAVDADDLSPVQKVRPNTLFAVAAWVGSTRLIDNLLITREGNAQL